MTCSPDSVSPGSRLLGVLDDIPPRLIDSSQFRCAVAKTFCISSTTLKEHILKFLDTELHDPDLELCHFALIGKGRIGIVKSDLELYR